MSIGGRHYDEFPYDVGVVGSVTYRDHRFPFGRFLAQVDGGTALDVGCGPGNHLVALAERAEHVTGIDASERTVALARARVAELGPRVVVDVGDALALAHSAASMDCVTAIGSLHHTGDAARGFAELCRVLKPGGHGFVALYHRGSYYERMYTTAGAVARAARRSTPLDRVVNGLVLLPAFAAYYVLGRAVVHRRIERVHRAQLRNYFADQLLNPVVSFHDEPEVREWCLRGAARVTDVAVTHAGALLNVAFEKTRVV